MLNSEGLGPNEPRLPVSPPPQLMSSPLSSSTTRESCWPRATRVAGWSSSSGSQRCVGRRAGPGGGGGPGVGAGPGAGGRGCLSRCPHGPPGWSLGSLPASRQDRGAGWKGCAGAGLDRAALGQEGPWSAQQILLVAHCVLDPETRVQQSQAALAQYGHFPSWAEGGCGLALGRGWWFCLSQAPESQPPGWSSRIGVRQAAWNTRLGRCF